MVRAIAKNRGSVGRGKMDALMILPFGEGRLLASWPLWDIKTTLHGGAREALLKPTRNVF
jgi:hypothetical protein